MQLKWKKKYFTSTEILALLTSNFFSILFYNSEVWHIPTLKPPLKQLLLSASANALKISQKVPNPFESFINVHKSCKRATPNQMMQFKHAIILHNLYSINLPQADWLDLNFNQILTSRQTSFKVIKSNNFLVGNNLITNRLATLNGKVDLKDLNLSLDSFKIKYKKDMLTWFII